MKKILPPVLIASLIIASLFFYGMMNNYDQGYRNSYSGPYMNYGMMNNYGYGSYNRHYSTMHGYGNYGLGSYGSRGMYSIVL